MSSYRFVVTGAPVPKERPRFFRGRAYTPKRTRDYEEHVADCAFASGVKKIDGDVSLLMEIYVPDNRRRDGGNIAKAIEDGLNGAAYMDDSQIKSCSWTLELDRDRPRVEVYVCRMKNSLMDTSA